MEKTIIPPPMLTPVHGLFIETSLTFGYFDTEISKFSALRASVVIQLTHL